METLLWTWGVAGPIVGFVAGSLGKLIVADCYRAAARALRGPGISDDGWVVLYTMLQHNTYAFITASMSERRHVWADPYMFRDPGDQDVELRFLAAAELLAGMNLIYIEPALHGERMTLTGVGIDVARRHRSKREARALAAAAPFHKITGKHPQG